ncbi:MAG: Polysaccharide biosynthesis protein [Lentisphaerae bacterium ADurb.Bin242]|nr:MAG: Polysaccharide biosynthesis protein [Lentisphaerae bacterium ADurb.Bin242]
MSRDTRVFKNTVTNYFLVFLRLLEGILLTRWLYHFLGREYYGYWALLWSIFVYALLLDFGFGKAAQKYTARKLYETDPREYNRIISAILGIHAAMSVLILAGTWIGSIYLSVLTGVTDPEQLHYCRLVLLVFGIGTAATFPLGMFAEILVGLNLIYLRNYIYIAVRLLELCGIGLLLFAGGNLMALAVYTVTLNFISSAGLLVLSHRQIRSLRLRPRISFQTLWKLADFSFFIYIVSIANLVISKTSRLILGIFTGLGDVGTYQVGSRLPELTQNMTTQYQENISPIAASLHKEEHLPELRNVIFQAMRISCLIVTPAVVFAYVLTPEAMSVLFNVRDPQVNRVCRLLLISTYVFVAFRSVAYRFLMMSGRHRFLAAVQGADAVLNLGLSVALVYKYGLIGVVWGTMIPNIFLGLAVVLPYLCIFLKQKIAILLFRVYVVPLLAAALPASGLFLLHCYTPGIVGTLWGLSAAGLIAFLFYLAVIWPVALTSPERAFLAARLQHARSVIKI